jgi:hypothetical protein
MVTGSISQGESTYRAAWTRDQLVIMTRETSVLALSTGTTRSTTRTSRRAFSIDADGLLIVDVITLVDPTPNGPTQPAPVPGRSVYRKAS